MTPDRLREFRAKYNLSQPDLAVILKRSQGWVENVERPNLRNYAKMTFVVELALRYYEAFPEKIGEALADERASRKRVTYKRPTTGTRAC